MRFLLFTVILFVSQQGRAAEPGTVTIEPSRTSIYVGSVTLTSTPLGRTSTGFTGKYSAKVFPYFFESEKGEVTINATPADLARLTAGDPVDFTGSARADSGDLRTIEGRATPTSATSGKIKIRIFVSKRIQLIFNTTYSLK